MKRLISLIPLLILTSCQWILNHPQEDAEAVELIEKAGEEVYEFESRTLSPGVPPMKLNGPTGPTKG